MAILDIFHASGSPWRMEYWKSATDGLSSQTSELPLTWQALGWIEIHDPFAPGEQQVQITDRGD